MNFIEFCNSNPDYDTKKWESWIEDYPEKEVPDHEKLGLLKEEYEELKNKLRSMDFYIFKRKFNRSIYNLWGGCYIKFAFEIDLHEPHIEFGWVDVVSNEQGFCKIQCDDNYFGCRALTIRIIDVLEILPYKERPLIYFKTMNCGQCNLCDRASNELPPINCPHYSLFSSIVNKQQLDNEYIKAYQGIKTINEENKKCSNNCQECYCGGHHE